MTYSVVLKTKGYNCLSRAIIIKLCFHHRVYWLDLINIFENLIDNQALLANANIGRLTLMQISLLKRTIIGFLQPIDVSKSIEPESPLLA